MWNRGELWKALVLSYVLECHGAPCNPQKLIDTKDLMLSKLGIFLKASGVCRRMAEMFGLPLRLGVV